MSIATVTRQFSLVPRFLLQWSGNETLAYCHLELGHSCMCDNMDQRQTWYFLVYSVHCERDQEHEGSEGDGRDEESKRGEPSLLDKPVK